MTDGPFYISTDFSVSERAVEALGEGFNKHGVRERDDGSIDVIFEAMEPGVRHEGTPFEVEITSEYLQQVAAKDYGERLPMQMNHSWDQADNVGWIYGDRVQFSDGKLRLMGHVPNTGSSVRSDVIADFTHDPPAITDGSVGFDPTSLTATEDGSGPPKFTDGRLQEFSLTPFPAGYDDGGLAPEFSADQFYQVSNGDSTPRWGDSRLSYTTRQL